MSQATLGTDPYQNSNLFSSYYLSDRIDDLDEWECDDEARDAFERLQNLWELEGGLVDSYEEDELLTAWIDKVTEVLGFDRLSETTLPDGGGYTDRLLFDTPETRRDAAARKKDGDREAMFGLASVVLEAKQWDADFTKRFAEQRSYRDASHQIKYYLEHTPERLQWGILTNGRKWRLYGTKDYATEIYYEVDLPELLEAGNLEQFKYFFAFFRSAAFRETAGSSFLDTVWSESETAAQELGEDLQDNVFTALRVLGEGFIQTNDLSIDPADSEARAELKEQSLVLLYRLMFVLYAESRGLIHPDDPKMQTEYEENFSLTQRRTEIHDRIEDGDSYEDFSGYSTGIWSQLQDLFGLIDKGEEDLGIPPYNGGLFDDASHAFLADNEVADRYLAEVIHRLGTTEGEDGSPVLADYADLDTRHLGSIYEGLLEHEFRIVPEQYAAVAEDGGEVWRSATEVSVADAVETVDEGHLYVVNDDGERKATGAYYTPDYVVSYIVEETVDPLIAEIKADLAAEGLEPGDKGYFAPFFEQVKELTVLDPAMGSGHFLTSATAYLTEQVMEVVREQEIQSYDEQDLRRQIAKECIYGVDINGMAVELGKLSMWLETLAADKPLAFLDHHLKAGNSLVGSDITDVLAEDGETEDGQLTLGQALARARQQTLGHVMDLMQDLLAIDNDGLADIKSMEELYDEIRADPLYKRLFEVANVHTAAQFGVDVPEGVYEKMAGAIDDTDKWAEIREEDWFTSAQALAGEQSFFHWELEYPEVFFSEDGEKQDDAGFDALIGNPPWVRSINLKSSDMSSWRYYRNSYQSASSGEYDIYLCFIEKGISLINSDGEFGYITPNKWITSQVGSNLRDILSCGKYAKSIIDFGSHQLFEGITTYSSLLFLNKQNNSEVYIQELIEEDTSDHPDIKTDQFWQNGTVETESLTSDPWSFNLGPIGNLFDKLATLPSLGDEANVFMGTGTRADSVFLLEQDGSELYSPALEETVSIEEELLRPGLKGSDIENYSFERNRRLIFPYNIGDNKCEPIQPKELQTSYPKCWEYLNKNREELEQREGGKFVDEELWYVYGYPRSMNKLGNEKIVLPDVVNEAEMAYDSEGWYILDTAYGIVSDNHDERYLTAILNSDLLTSYLQLSGTDLRGGYFRMKTAYLNPFPIPDLKIDIRENKREQFRDIGTELAENIVEGSQNTDTIEIIGQEGSQEVLVPITESRSDLTKKLKSLNLSLLDHLGSYSDGPTLSDIGLTQPPRGAAESILQQTAAEKPNLRVGEASVVRESDNTVEIRLTARYKPSETRPEGGSRTGTGDARGGSEDDALDESDFEVDQWGYTETDPQPALRITDLTKAEADLIAAFVPVAVDEAGGFAGFRETATKTNSLVDRLRKLTLPAVDDVEAELTGYMQTVERAEELEAKIESTDALIDEIVYELYGLTDEEIEIVEEAVGE
jgi:N-6 DNA Methylase./Eco57I restriction endonuclease.